MNCFVVRFVSEWGYSLRGHCRSKGYVEQCNVNVGLCKTHSEILRSEHFKLHGLIICNSSTAVFMIACCYTADPQTCGRVPDELVVAQCRVYASHVTWNSKHLCLLCPEPRTQICYQSLPKVSSSPNLRRKGYTYDS